MPAVVGGAFLTTGATHGDINTTHDFGGSGNAIAQAIVFMGDAGTVGLGSFVVDGVAGVLVDEISFPDPGNPGIQIWRVYGVQPGTRSVATTNAGGGTSTSVIMLEEIEDVDQTAGHRVLVKNTFSGTQLRVNIDTQAGDFVRLYGAAPSTANATVFQGTDEVNLDFGSDAQLLASQQSAGGQLTIGYDFDASEAVSYIAIALMAPQAAGFTLVADPIGVDLTLNDADLTHQTPNRVMAADPMSFVVAIIDADLRHNLPIAPVWGAMGDSNTDEYRAESNIGGGTAWEATTLNWLELMVNHRGLNCGPWGTGRPEPRRSGYEFNYSRFNEDMDHVITVQTPGVAAQIAAGQVTHVAIQGTVNELINSGPVMVNDVYLSPDGINGQSGTPIATHVANYCTPFLDAIDDLVAAGAVGIVAIMPPNYFEYEPTASDPAYDETGKGYVLAFMQDIWNTIQTHCNNVNTVQGQIICAAIRWDELFAPVWATADGQFVDVGGEAIDYTQDSPNGDPHYRAIAGHTGTVFEGIVANAFMQAANELPTINFQQFTTNEILANAGIPVGYTMVADPMLMTATLQDTRLGSELGIIADPISYSSQLHDLDMFVNRKVVAEPIPVGMNLQDLSFSLTVYASSLEMSIGLVDADLRFGRTLVADPLMAGISLRDTSLRAARRLLTDRIAVSGPLQDINLIRNLRVHADRMTLNSIMRDAILSEISPVLALTAETMTVGADLRDVGFHRNYGVVVEPLTIDASLSDVGLVARRRMSADSMIVLMDLHDTDLGSGGRILAANEMVLDMFINDAELLRGDPRLRADTIEYTISLPEIILFYSAENATPAERLVIRLQMPTKINLRMEL